MFALLVSVICFIGAAFLLFCVAIFAVHSPWSVVIVLGVLHIAWRLASRGDGRMWPAIFYDDETTEDLPANHIGNPQGRSSLDGPYWKRPLE